MNRFIKFCQRIGYLRAAGEMQRQGRPDLAVHLIKMASEL